MEVLHVPAQLVNVLVRKLRDKLLDLLPDGHRKPENL
jgi:hypothetical protein